MDKPQNLMRRGVPPVDGPSYHGQSVHLVDKIADYAGVPRTAAAIGRSRLVTDEQVAADGAATGMWDFPQVVPTHLMSLVALFCEGVTESRPPNQFIGRNDSPYIDRWFLARKAIVPVASVAPDFLDHAPFMRSEIENIYLHGYHRGDADEPHDHPWPNASLVVRGWYREAIYSLEGRLIGDLVRRPGDVVLRSARSVHAILETSDNCLSLFATLRKERDWGFHTAAGFVPWREFDERRVRASEPAA